MTDELTKKRDELTKCIDCGAETAGSARCKSCWDDKCGKPPPLSKDSHGGNVTKLPLEKETGEIVTNAEALAEKHADKCFPYNASGNSERHAVLLFNAKSSYLAGYQAAEGCRLLIGLPLPE